MVKQPRTIIDVPNTTEDLPVKFFKVVIGGKKIEIECQYHQVFNLCKDYLADFDEPDYTIKVTKDDINYAISKRPPIAFTNSDVALNYAGFNVETIIVYLKIAKELLRSGFLLLHGAAIAVNEKCFIFIADSGVGKTTHVNNWIKVIPGSYVVNGDKPLIDVENKLVYGTPWCGKEGMNTNKAVPLSGIISLERGISNNLQPIPFHDILPTLIQQCYIPTDRLSIVKSYQLIDELRGIPYYKLTCNMDEESAIVSYNGLIHNT